MTHAEFAGCERHYRSVAVGIATKLTRKNPGWREDLVQEAMLAVWSLDLSKARSHDVYIRNAMKYRMIDHLRKLKLDRYVDLTTAYRWGYRVIGDWDGRPCLGRSVQAKRGRWVSQVEFAKAEQLERLI